MTLDGLFSKLRRLLSRLDRASSRLLRDGLQALADTGDPGYMLQETTRIEDWGYYAEPRPRFQGFYHDCGGDIIELPEPLMDSGVDVLKAIRSRRSRREYSDEPLALQELGTILYHAVGVTGYELGWPLRTYPSAGGLQPVELYVNAVNVEGLERALYYYHPARHALCRLRDAIHPSRLAHICLDQEHVAAAPAALIVTAVYSRSASKYRARAYRYIHVDAGAVMQNVYLAAEALGLATVAVGAFYDHELCREIGIDCRWEIPLLVMPVGRRP